MHTTKIKPLKFRENLYFEIILKCRKESQNQSVTGSPGKVQSEQNDSLLGSGISSAIFQPYDIDIILYQLTTNSESELGHCYDASGLVDASYSYTPNLNLLL